MKRRLIGMTTKGAKLYFNENSENLSMIATGKSGSGKTQTMFNQVIQAAEKGEHLIVINWRSTVTRDTIMPELYERYESLVCRHDVASEGLAVPIFKKRVNDAGLEESDASIAKRITAIFESTCELSPTQKNATFNAVLDVYNKGYYKEDGVEAIYRWLTSQKSSTARAAAGKLLQICGTGMLTEGPFFSDSKPITEINLNGLEYGEQLLFVRFILNFIKREAMNGAYEHSPITIFLDEIQNILQNKGCEPLEVLLNEGRRLKVKLLLACPSLLHTGKNKSNSLMQCATKLCFEPLEEERAKLAEIVDPYAPESMNYALSILKVGECIAKGSFVIEAPNEVTRTEEGIFKLKTLLSKETSDVRSDKLKSVDNKEKAS